MKNRFAMLVFWHDHSLIHPDNLTELIKVKGNASRFISFEKLEQEGEYLILSFEGHSFRIKPEAITELEPTQFVIGQKVKTVTGTLRTGWISDISWHFKSKRHIYLLEIEVENNQRKKLSCYYGEEDLEAV